MIENEALLAAVCAEPDDDGPRLVYADWLEDHGEAERAHFIRAQIELAKVPWYDPLCVRARHADSNLISGYRYRYDYSVPPWRMHWSEGAYRRGFPWRLTVSDVPSFVADAERLFARVPIGCLRVDGPNPLVSGLLLGSPQLAKVRRIEFINGRLDAEAVRLLLESPHAAQVDELKFGYSGLTPEGAATLLAHPGVARLRELMVDDYVLARAALGAAFRGAAPLPLLQTLHLSHACIRPDGLAGVLHGLRDAPALQELDLEGQLAGGGIGMILAAPFTRRLRSLGLERTVPLVDGVRRLAAAEFDDLRQLDLSSNRLGPVAARALADSPALHNLAVLTLACNPLGDKGVQALAASPYLSNLVRLDIQHCDMGEAGAKALLESARFKNLVGLWAHIVDDRPSARAVWRALRERFPDSSG